MREQKSEKTDGHAPRVPENLYHAWHGIHHYQRQLSAALPSGSREWESEQDFGLG